MHASGSLKTLIILYLDFLTLLLRACFLRELLSLAHSLSLFLPPFLLSHPFPFPVCILMNDWASHNVFESTIFIE